MKPLLVQRYLECRLEQSVRVISCEHHFPGVSRETWFVRCKVGKLDAERCFTLRRDPEGGAIVPTTLAQEWEIYSRLATTPVPVATPLWYETDPHWLQDERASFVRDFLDGTTHESNLTNPDQRYDSLREAVAKQHAEKLALLHPLSWKEHGFDQVLPVPSSPADSARLEIELWWGRWDEIRGPATPLITELFYWLRDRLPTCSPRISLCKGNNGLGEEIWRDGGLVAFSDFELAALSSPAQDWGNCQGVLALWDRERTLQHYERSAGYRLDRAELTFWQVWGVLKGICCMSAGLRRFVEGADQRPVIVAGFGRTKLLDPLLAALISGELSDADATLARFDAQRLGHPAHVGFKAAVHPQRRSMVRDA